MSTRFLQRQEIKVKTQDSRTRIHQAIYLRYRSFKRGGGSELSYAQNEDRSQATKLPIQAEDRDRTATFSSQGLRITLFPSLELT